MRLFISIAAVLALIFGFALLAVPAAFYAPIGVAFTPLIGTIAQAHGATLVGLGVINWLARDSDRKGILAILAGNLVVQILSLVVVLRTMALGVGMKVAPGMVIHIVLGALFAFFLVRTMKPASAAA